jgi:phosphate/sulfate permease
MQRFELYIRVSFLNYFLVGLGMLNQNIMRRISRNICRGSYPESQSSPRSTTLSVAIFSKKLLCVSQTETISGEVLKFACTYT